MRLLVLGPGSPFRGGIAQTTTEAVSALAAAGHRLTFLTPRRQYPSWLFPGGDDSDPEACPHLDCAEAVLDPLQPLSWPRMRARAVDLAADAWLLPYWTWAWAGCWRFLLHGDRRPPAVVIVHNPADHDAGPVQRLAARLVLGRADGLFTHADVLAAGLRESYPWLPVASHPLPSGRRRTLPDRAAARRAMALPEDSVVVGFFGIIRPYKGVDLLVEAVARLPARFRLLVAGEPWGELGRELRAQVERLGLRGRVRLELEWVPETRLAELLAALDVLVLPYRSGSQSYVAPLALAHGVPVVASRVGGLVETVDDGISGVLVEPGSVDQLVAALQGLDRRSLAQLSRGALAVGARHSWDGYAAAVVGLLQGITARR